MTFNFFQLNFEKSTVDFNLISFFLLFYFSHLLLHSLSLSLWIQIHQNCSFSEFKSPTCIHKKKSKFQFHHELAIQVREHPIGTPHHPSNQKKHSLDETLASPNPLQSQNPMMMDPSYSFCKKIYIGVKSQWLRLFLKETKMKIRRKKCKERDTLLLLGCFVRKGPKNPTT